MVNGIHCKNYARTWYIQHTEIGNKGQPTGGDTLRPFKHTSIQKAGRKYINLCTGHHISAFFHDIASQK